MNLFIECKSDETLAFALGVPRKNIEHALGRASVCAQLSRRTGVVGMVDEDPGSAVPPYLKSLVEQSWEREVRVLLDKERNNRIVILSPRLEEWLVRSTREAGLKMTDFGFESDNGLRLHAEINQRLESLQRLVEALLAAKSPRILRLQGLLKQ
jgi:hypothetical protein